MSLHRGPPPDQLRHSVDAFVLLWLPHPRETSPIDFRASTPHAGKMYASQEADYFCSMGKHDPG